MKKKRKRKRKKVAKQVEPINSWCKMQNVGRNFCRVNYNT